MGGVSSLRIIESSKIAVNFFLFVVENIINSNGPRRMILQIFQQWMSADLLSERFPKPFLVLEVLNDEEIELFKFENTNEINSVLKSSLATFNLTNDKARLQNIDVIEQWYGDLSHGALNGLANRVDSMISECVSQSDDSMMLQCLKELHEWLLEICEELDYLEMSLG